MTNLGTIILLLVCVGVGFVLEPLVMSLREVDKPETSEAAKEPEPEKKPEPAPAPQPVAPSIAVDLGLIQPEDFPAEVKLRETYLGQLKERVIELEPGSMVRPLRLRAEDNVLVFQISGTHLEGEIDIDSTNFKELVIPVMMKRLSEGGGVKEPEPEPVFLDQDAIVALIKSHVDSGEISAFSANQVTSWEAGEDMDFDGQHYQTGRVTYEQADTIIGPQNFEAIALIKNGKVVKWIGAVTKLRL